MLIQLFLKNRSEFEFPHNENPIIKCQTDDGEINKKIDRMLEKIEIVAH